MTSSNEQVIRIIEKRINAQKLIPDMVLDDFIELVAKTCKEICAPIEEASSAFAKAESKVFDAVFDGFAQRLQDIYAYELFDDLTSDMVFRLGACWGGVTTAQKCEEHQQDSEHKEEELRFIRKNRDLFDIIKKKPGRCHHEIAQALGISDPRLTQIVKEAKPYQLISTSIQGRSKHYYLTRKGEEQHLTFFYESEQAVNADAASSLDGMQTNDREAISFDRNFDSGQAINDTDNADVTGSSGHGKLNDNLQMNLVGLMGWIQYARE